MNLTIRLVSCHLITVAVTLIPGADLVQADDGGPNEALVTIDHVEAVPGTTALVGVTIEVDDLIGSFNFNAEADGLTVADILYDGPLFSSGWEGWDTTPSMTPNISAACIFPQDQLTGLQDLFTLEIDVPAGAQPGSQLVVDFTSASVTNYSFETFEVTVEAGGLSIVEELDPCPADIAGGDGAVDALDLLSLLNAWGSSGSDADVNGDGTVGVPDLLAVLAAWGQCP
jgi:hypothetical protein